MGSGWNCARVESSMGRGGEKSDTFRHCTTFEARVFFFHGESQRDGSPPSDPTRDRLRNVSESSPNFPLFYGSLFFLVLCMSISNIDFLALSPRAACCWWCTRQWQVECGAHSSRNESHFFSSFHFISFQKKETRNSSENSRIRIAKRSFSLSKCPVVVVWTDVYRLCEGVREFYFNFFPPSMWGRRKQRARQQHEINIYNFFYCVCSTCDYKLRLSRLFLSHFAWLAVLPVLLMMTSSSRRLFVCRGRWRREVAIDEVKKRKKIILARHFKVNECHLRWKMEMKIECCFTLSLTHSFSVDFSWIFHTNTWGN